MEPIVHGLSQKYSGCLALERVNFHQPGRWHALINPFGAPEFALLDNGGKVLYRWSGVTAADEFDQVLKPLCG